MPYTINAVSEDHGSGYAELKALTKKDAVETAVGLLAQGLKDVTITDEIDGRVYYASHLEEFFDDDE